MVEVFDTFDEMKYSVIASVLVTTIVVYIMRNSIFLVLIILGRLHGCLSTTIHICVLPESQNTTTSKILVLSSSETSPLHHISLPALFFLFFSLAFLKPSLFFLSAAQEEKEERSFSCSSHTTPNKLCEKCAPKVVDVVEGSTAARRKLTKIADEK